LNLGKFSFGIGDRFGRQGEAQLRAFVMAKEKGADVVPVWNKSQREHTTIGSEPASVRAEADTAAKALGWRTPYHVDADHIRLDTVDRFLACSDFFTIDVAEWIGKTATAKEIRGFVARHPELTGWISIPGIERPMEVSEPALERMATKYLLAVQEAARIYRHIAETKGAGTFITEVSMDETDCPQTPLELLAILAGLADEAVPVQTIAPKFTGRFNKGVDYVGDVAWFEQEFSEDLAVIAFAMKQYGLPGSLKLSVHSGSDKFSIYGPIRRGLERFGAGIHVKTAGTTWLEEVIGLAEADGMGLALAKEVYAKALAHATELCAPYASVIDIDRTKLPSEQTVSGWSAEQFVSAVRHNLKNPAFNPHVRQLLHVGYKIAAQMGRRYLDALDACRDSVSRNVTKNLYQRHLTSLFLDRI
jgi:hypothetical protein